jgi:hypothetical protein
VIWWMSLALFGVGFGGTLLVWIGVVAGIK